jgi:hypothetical protein
MIKSGARLLVGRLRTQVGRLPPGWQRVVWGVIPVALFVVVVSFLLPHGTTGPANPAATGKGSVGSMLLTGKEHDDALSAAIAEIERLRHQQSETAQDVASLRAVVETATRRTGAGAATTPGEADTRGPSSAPPASLPASPTAPAGGPKTNVSVRPGMDLGQLDEAGPPAGDQIVAALAPGAVWKTTASSRPAMADARAGGTQAAAQGSTSGGASSLHVFRQDVAVAASRGAGVAADTHPVFELPPGAILSGVLLTGIDAPTAVVARRDPVPALLRVKQDTILPNRHAADQRECFVLLSGYGDLSAERAYLRAEDLSCVLEDGSTFHERVEGYASDETGRLGVRGPVVSRQGAFIARSLLIGVMQGIAEAFGRNQEYGIGLNQGGQLSFQQAGDQTTGGAISGAGKGLDRIADFYLQQAVAMFPVIEINAGRRVDLVLTKAVRVKLPGGAGE